MALWPAPSRRELTEAFERALKPFDGMSVMSVDSFNIKASNSFFRRVYVSKESGAVLSFQLPQDFPGLLSQCTRLEGQALLSPMEALDHLMARFFRQMQVCAEAKMSYFPADWVLSSQAPPAGEAAQVSRLLASLSLVEVRLWKQL
ncbi:MAG TPA: hypothetical protein VMU88_08360 [bacterium]|nr:hypothetical protein [bacterium]